MLSQLQKSIVIVFISLLLFGCASDGPKGPPRLELSPNILVEESKIGDGYIIQLTIKNQIDSKATSAFGINNNLRELYSELITEAFERQDFEVITPEDRDPDDKVTEIEISITTLNNEIKQATLSSNIIANAAISVTAINSATVLTLNFSSTRTKEVPLKPSVEEVTELTELAIAQVIKRLSIDKKLIELRTKK